LETSAGGAKKISPAREHLGARERSSHSRVWWLWLCHQSRSLFDEQGAAHTVWAGNDPTTALNYLILKTPKTVFKTDRVKVTLAANVVSGWNEIDAVQLVGSDQ